MNPFPRRRFLGVALAGAAASLLRGATPPVAPDPLALPADPPASPFDLAALAQLANEVAQVLNRDEAAAFAGLFTADAVVEHDGETAAAPDLAAWHAARRARARATGHFHRFQILTPVIDLRGSEACLTAYATADAYHYADQRLWFQRGRLRARARRDAGGVWRFQTWSVRFDCRYPSTPPNWLHNGRVALQEVGHPVSPAPKRK